VSKHAILFMAAMALAGCTLQNQSAPSLTGPSELALSLAITASPDLITQDGTSQSVVSVVARDAAGQPIRGLSMRAETIVNGFSADFGVLSSRTISTATDGRASLIYLSPAPPPVTAGNDNFVTIVFTPIGVNYANTIDRSVQIRLARPGLILPPNGTPTPSFFFSPSAPHENETVQFDASASTDDGQIVSYTWAFGDGSSGSGVRPTHAYSVSGTYNVILTVTDDRGLRASTAPTPVAVTTAANPTASFTFSPTAPGVNDVVNLNAEASSVAPGRTIVSYAWDFGDGSIGAGARTTHAYGKANTYTIVLTVTDNTGRKGVTSNTIPVK
jgi:PKD repeat protein